MTEWIELNESSFHFYLPIYINQVGQQSVPQSPANEVPANERPAKNVPNVCSDTRWIHGLLSGFNSPRLAMQ